MKKTAWFQLLVLLLITLGAAPPAEKGPKGLKVSITTRLDKTALWVGDTLNYTIRVIHDRDLEFVLDNLKKENLPLAPFVVHGVTIHQGDWAQDKKLLEVTIRLSSYEFGKTELTIPPFNLYYFKGETGRKAEDALAEAVQVPAVRVGLRSTLSGNELKPRDFKPLSDIDLRWGIGALLLGLTGMTFLAVRGVRGAWRTFHTRRQAKGCLSPRVRQKLAEEGLERIRSIRGETLEELTLFYTEVSQFLREYLSQWLEIEAPGLTPEEIGMALEKANVEGPLAQEIRNVLEQCDAVHYGKDGLRLGGDLRDQIFGAMERIVRSHQA